MNALTDYAKRFQRVGATAINLRQLRYFVKIVEVGNITRAAEQLYVAQPALGLQIRTLERDLGVPLLVRHSRGVTPTEPGRILYERACAILKAVADAKKEISDFGGIDHETISLGLTPGVMNLIGQAILLDARLQLPEVHLSLIEEMSYVLVDALERDEIDVAVAYSVPERPGLLRTPVIEEEMLLVTKPGALVDKSGSIEFADAMKLPLVLAKERDPLRRLIATTAEGMALTPNIAFEASSVGVMRNLIASGAAASIMPFGSAKKVIDGENLVALRITNPVIKRTLYVVRSSHRASFKNERELMEFIQDFLIKLSELLGPLSRRLPGLDKPLPSIG